MPLISSFLDAWEGDKFLLNQHPGGSFPACRRTLFAELRAGQEATLRHGGKFNSGQSTARTPSLVLAADSGSLFCSASVYLLARSIELSGSFPRRTENYDAMGFGLELVVFEPSVSTCQHSARHFKPRVVISSGRTRVDGVARPSRCVCLSNR